MLSSTFVSLLLKRSKLNSLLKPLQAGSFTSFCLRQWNGVSLTSSTQLHSCSLDTSHPLSLHDQACRDISQTQQCFRFHSTLQAGGGLHSFTSRSDLWQHLAGPQSPDVHFQNLRKFSTSSKWGIYNKRWPKGSAAKVKVSSVKNLNGSMPKGRMVEQTQQRLSRSLRHSLSYQKLKDQLKSHRKASREAVDKVQQKITSNKENIKTIPNLLTTLRMASAPLLAYLVVNEFFVPAFSIFAIAGFSDMLDGYIARNFKNQRTALGTALDPLADKLLMSFLTVSLTSVGLVPVPVTVLILGRDAGLIAGTFYIRYISLAPPRTLSRYFDVSHVTAKLYPSTISKANTLIQLSFIGLTLAAPVFDFVGHPWLQALMYTTAATTFMSGADYVLTWRKRLKIVKND